jgi:putative colanic acid biosynthesis acetyltransferase WcaF
LSYRDVQRLDTFKVPEGFRERPKWFIFLWWLTRDTIFICSPQPMYGFRAWLLRCFGARVGQGTAIRSTVRITYPWMVSIGNFAQIGDFAELYTLGRITIGDHAVVSQNSYLCTGSHDYKSLSFNIYSKPITIGPQAWVASHCFIGPGVTVGFGAVVGARSTVMKHIPPLKIAYGNPARVVGDRPTLPALVANVSGAARELGRLSD